ncbi:MAG: radical SAM protein [Candidatus Nanoarchaeia archaeon]
MEFWKRVHWFLTSKCNEKCRFCFKPNFDLSNLGNEKTLSKVLADNYVKEVVFTGGEPLLSKSLEPSLEILANSLVDTSIHTNAMLLDFKLLKRLVKLTNEIAIPIDSMDKRTQEYLRKIDCLPKVKRVLEELQDSDIRIGIHTTATAINVDHIPQIYDFLCNRRFDYWRIYEFNSNLVSDRFTNLSRFKEVEKLKGKNSTKSDGGVNSLLADFLLIEEKMSKHKDKRVQFVGVSDYNRAPYFFLDSNGDTYLATWFSQARKPIGNLLRENFRKVKNKAIREYSKGPFFDEDSFIETENNQPLFARASWQGNIFVEELQDLNPRYCERFIHLSSLYLERIKKQGKAPYEAELQFL